MVKTYTERRKLDRTDGNINISVNVCKIKVNIRNKNSIMLHHFLMNSGTDMVHA